MSFLLQPLDAALPDICRGSALTIGNFDGVHRGHQALVGETVRQARQLAAPALAVTFDPHPQQLLRPESFQPILTTLERRAELLQGYGIDHVLVLRITPSFLQLGARDFFDQILVERLGARAVIEGFNFGFGRGREGTTQTLTRFGEQVGMKVALVPALESQGAPVSTSRVRGELQSGAVASARALLGRPYRLDGIVETGQRRGQRLGFPTANLGRIATLIPGDGVYAVRVPLEDRTWPGAVNIGPNPTFGEGARKVEVHLIGYKGDLYSRSLSVDFVEKIRDVRTFSGPDELKAQIDKDVRAAVVIGRVSEGVTR